MTTPVTRRELDALDAEPRADERPVLIAFVAGVMVDAGLRRDAVAECRAGVR